MRLTGPVLALGVLLLTVTARSQELTPARALAHLRELEPRIEKLRLALEYGEALEALQRISRACPDRGIQREIARRADPLSRERGLLLRLIAVAETGRELELPSQVAHVRPVGAEGYLLVGTGEVRPWRTLRPRQYLWLLDQLDLTPRERLDVAVFCFHRGLHAAATVAIRTAREGDLDLKAESDRLIAAHRGEPVPRGGYELLRGRYVTLDQRDVGVALLGVAAELEGGSLSPTEERLLADLKLAVAQLATDTAPTLLATLGDRLTIALRQDEATVRGLLVSFAGTRLAGSRLELEARLDALRTELLALIAVYTKPQQPRVDEFRRSLTELWEEACTLRRQDERRLTAMSPEQAWAMVERLQMRERALDRIRFYLSVNAPDAPRPPPAAARSPDRATLHVLPVHPYRGLEEVFWLALNERAGRHVYVLERSIDVRRRLPELHPWERMVIRDVLARNVRSFNRLVATSLGAAERECIEVTNDYRTSLGLRPVEVDERVVQAARGHSQEMTDLGYFGHVSPVERNRGPTDRLRNAGYAGGAAENCLGGRVSGRGAFEGWYHSPGHHRGMLSALPHIGVGRDRANLNWTMVLAGTDTAWRLAHTDLAPATLALLETDIEQAAMGRSDARARVLARGGAALAAVARRALGHAGVEVEGLARIDLLIVLAEQEGNTHLLRASVDALVPFLLSARREVRDSAFGLLRRLIPWKLEYGPGIPARDRQRAITRLLARVEKEREKIGTVREKAPRPERPRTTSRPPSIKTPLRPLTRRDRKRLARKNGGSALTEQAVERGLKWLAAHQNENGSFGALSYRSSCSPEPGCPDPGRKEFEVGLTGLALLAFLAAGNTPEMGEYATVVRDGVDFLMLRLQDFGKFATTSGSYMYSHALATQALLEAYAYTADPEIGRAARRALDYLIYAQHAPSGGWRYHPKQAGDTSVTGWVVLALHSARKAGMAPVGLAGARRFLERVTEPGYYRVGYQNPLDRPGNVNRLCAVGMVIRLVLGTKRANPHLRFPAERLVADAPAASRPDPYYWYYGTLAMFQMGGEAWQTWNKALVRAVLDTQDPNHRACTHGSWAPRGEFTAEGGRLYTTALHVLTLTVYYRYDLFPELNPRVFTGAIDDLVRPHLERLGDTGNAVGREVAKRILEEEFGHGAAPLLISELETAGPGSRRDDLAEVLASVATDEHVPAILRLMEGSRGGDLEHLSRALGRVATRRNLAVLVAHLRHENRAVRGHSARGLSRIGDDSAIAPLLELQSRERDDWVRGKVVEALHEITHRSALDRFLAASGDLSSGRRGDLREGLWILNGTGVLEDLWMRCEKRADLRRQVLGLLVGEGRAAVVPILFLSLRSDSANVRKDAMRILRTLTGQNFGFEPEADEGARREALDRWKAWWEESRAELFPTRDR